MNYIVITVILTAVCAAFLFAQEADEISKEIERDKPHPPRSSAGAPKHPGPAVAFADHTPDVRMNPVAAVADWDTLASGIHITGTSRMGTQTVAIINGKFSGIGDLVEVRHNGHRYQWRVRRIQPDGKVNLERYAVKTEPAVVQQEK